MAKDVYIVPGTGGHGRARADALLEVIGSFGCRVAVYGYDATRNDKFLVLVAAQPVLDALEILLPSVAITMERAARAAASAYASCAREALPDMTAGAQRRSLTVPYFRSYLRGFGTGAAEQIRAIRTDATEAGGHALAQSLAVEARRVEEVFTADFPDARMLKPECGGHAGARRAGIDAGQRADLGDDYTVRHDLVFAELAAC